MGDVPWYTRYLHPRVVGAVLVAVSALSVGCAGRGRVDAYNDYAIAAAKNRLWAEAAARWEQALELDPADGRVWNNLGVAYEADERFEDAIAAYAEANGLDPDNSHYIRNLRRCERNRDRAAAVGDADDFPDEDEYEIDELRDEHAEDELDYPGGGHDDV